MLKSIRGPWLVGIIIFSVVLLFVDRYYWAQISQWREDQATNLWLGYTRGFQDVPVGLISSEDIPNPNGMVLLGLIMSRLPGLFAVSFLLGAIQIALFILLGWKAFGQNWQGFLLITSPILTSVILRSSSVEFWNQYIITLINILFLFWALRYLEKPSVWNLPPILLLILLAPSLYLAGIVNALSMTVILLGMLIFKRPDTHGWVTVLVILLVIVGLSVLLTWLPYFTHVNLKQLADYNKTPQGPVHLLQAAWESLLGLPTYVPFQWADRSVFSLAFKHADPRILSTHAQVLLRLAGRAYLFQAIFAFAAFGYGTYSIFKAGISGKATSLSTHPPYVRITVLSGLFIGLAYTFSVWLGGPAWREGARPDQIVQFLPMFLILIFLLPQTIAFPGRSQRVIQGILFMSLTFFGIINMACGFFIIRDHLHFRGEALTEADIPLIDKIAAVDFIAKDWLAHSDSNIIPVDYDLGGGKWDWVPEFGLQLTQWYPAPMTIGRSFDYELFHRYELTNQQEGVQLRTFGTSRYLITYAFETQPEIQGGKMTHYIFGRLRVSVVDK